MTHRGFHPFSLFISFLYVAQMLNINPVQLPVVSGFFGISCRRRAVRSTAGDTLTVTATFTHLEAKAEWHTRHWMSSLLIDLHSFHTLGHKRFHFQGFRVRSGLAIRISYLFHRRLIKLRRWRTKNNFDLYRHIPIF